MKLYKYQGAGNDFVIIDNRDASIKLSISDINKICNRRFGIGADGLMLLESSQGFDFKMRYFNADGKEGSMCGNGGRCLVAFAAHMGISNFDFEAIDGAHTAQVLEYSKSRCIIRLKMIDIEKVNPYDGNKFFLDTGSPHLVIFVNNLKDYNVDEEGKYWRYHKDFPSGTNVNFVEVKDDEIEVRTYERGVEAETYACGTGVTASSIATYAAGHKCFTNNENNSIHFNVQALGDKLAVEFEPNFTNVYLTGPATFVFSTEWGI